MKKNNEYLNKIKQIEQQTEIDNKESNLYRARSVTVGTCFGGTTELSMRGDGSKFLYSIMQPVEVIELIHQLAANVGCHIAIKPRSDFASWREWRISEAEKIHLNGHPPFVNDMAPFNKLGMTGFNQEETEKLMNNWLQQIRYPGEEHIERPGTPYSTFGQLTEEESKEFFKKENVNSWDEYHEKQEKRIQEFLNKSVKKEEDKNETMAVKESSNKRRTKRTATSS